jgi:HPt (histidine-containing phosphotransfer) domain-containing protein
MINMDDFPNQIIGLVRIGDKALARELAHKIKGAAGNIGAMRLHSAAEILEVGLNGELSAETFHSFNQAFIQTISVIAAMQHPKDLLSTNGNSEALKQGVAELDFLLKGNDFISEALLNTLKPHLAAAQLDLFAELRKLINNLNYDQARTILRQLTDQEI